MIITLTTDFGLSDPFVGIMKGVIFRLNSDGSDYKILRPIEGGLGGCLLRLVFCLQAIRFRLCRRGARVSDDSNGDAMPDAEVPAPAIVTGVGANQKVGALRLV